jgi:radical SAM protein with 4Fe4S-binding SPASM domain
MVQTQDGRTGSGAQTPQKPGFYIQWHFIEACNLRCAHCYQDGYRDDMLPDHDLLAIADSLDAAMCRWNRVGRVSLTGGEPFKAPRQLALLIERFEQSPYFESIGILTNGTLIDANLVNTVRRHKKVREVQVSLDGATADTHDAVRGGGSFRLALAGIERLRAGGLPVAIMFTLTRQNQHESQEIVDLAGHLGCAAVTVERVIARGRAAGQDLDLAPNELRDVYERIAVKKRSLGGSSAVKVRTTRPLWCLVDGEDGGVCIAGLTGLTIMHDGTALPCRRLPLPLGNILRDGLFKIWYTSPVLWDLRRKNRMDSACLQCNLLDRCGGCRAAAFATAGNYQAKDPQCWRQDG